MKRKKFLQAAGAAIATFISQSSVFATEGATFRRVTRLSPTQHSQAQSIGKQLVRSRSLSFSALNNFVARTPSSNVMAVLFLVFRESIEATNEDKKYFPYEIKNV